MKEELKTLISKLADELKDNEYYRRAWSASIAMCYKDCEHQYRKNTGKKYLNKKDRHYIANNAAEHFLILFCGPNYDY